jgi:hypothetical protein
MRAMNFGTSCVPWVVAMVALTASASGCSVLSTCDMSDEPAQVYTGGMTVGGYYMSSPWEGPLLSFPAGKRYELVHGLGCTPWEVHVELSFSEQGAAGSSSVAPSAGNMSILERIDDKVIVVKNDTCSDMYLLVTAAAPDCSLVDGGADAEAGDSGGQDGI